MTLGEAPCIFCSLGTRFTTGRIYGIAVCVSHRYHFVHPELWVDLAETQATFKEMPGTPAPSLRACHTCGQSLPPVPTGEHILDAILFKDRHLIYTDANKVYWLSQGLWMECWNGSTN